MWQNDCGGFKNMFSSGTPHPSRDEAQYFSLPVWAWPSYLTYGVWQLQMRLLRCGFHLRHAHFLDHFLGKPATKSWAVQRHPYAEEGGLYPQHPITVHGHSSNDHEWAWRIFQLSYIAQDDHLTSGKTLDQTTDLASISDPQELRWCLLSAAKFWGNVLCTDG